MKTAHEQREELARLTRYANQLAADLADTRLRIRSILTDLGLPKFAVLKPFPDPVLVRPLQFGPKIAVREGRPEPWKSVRLHLVDGSTVLGVWTGVEWWGRGQLQYPAHWQAILSGPEYDSGKTASG
jgi:hypothetical protein